MVKKYILTGGPGAGKSTILIALELRGEYVIREAAEDVIKLKKAEGIENPWDYPNFQERILDLQLKREARIQHGIERIFIDRGLADGLAYTQKGTSIYERILSEAKRTRYEKIFIIENPRVIEKTSIRRENPEEALNLGLKLEQIYKELNYTTIRIPYLPIEERLELILKNILIALKIGQQWEEK